MNNYRKGLKKTKKKSHEEINESLLTKKDLKLPKRTKPLTQKKKKKNAYKKRKTKSTTSDIMRSKTLT